MSPGVQHQYPMTAERRRQLPIATPPTAAAAAAAAAAYVTRRMRALTSVHSA